MFTGIIEELGSIASLETHAGGAKIKIACRVVTEGSADGDSIAVNGVCLTALNVTPESFTADVSQETLNRSTLGKLRVGAPVNLERAVTPATRLGGHIVQGHVDATGTFLSSTNEGISRTIRVQFPKMIGPFLVFKGSISVEGISLTIAKLEDDFFEVAIIPKTWEMTNLSSLQPGDEVNLEADVVAKYVERILTYNKADQGVTTETLRKAGFIS